MGAGPPRWIAVCGPGTGATGEQLEAAEQAGAAVAAAGAVLVCGGLGGVMEAACRGARSRRGRTVGLLPGLEREAANGWVELAVPTGMGEMRNALIVRAADAVVAVGGGFGTLSEIALALKAGKPVVGVGSWDLGEAPVTFAHDGGEAVARALELADSSRTRA